MLSRRALARLMAGGLAGATLPAGFARAERPDERRFLFVFCSGGWDTTFCFTPVGPDGIADVEADHASATAQGIPFVDVAARPEVRRFFEARGQAVCVINGLEVPSVAHERCRQLVLTGKAGVAADDWPSIIAARSANALVLPHVVMDGPAFNRLHAAKVVRVGDHGQFPHLLADGALDGLDGLRVPPAPIETLEDAFLRGRVQQALAEADDDAMGAFLEDYSRALADHATLVDRRGEVQLGVSMRSCERDIVADAATVFDTFELGLARCGMIRYNGWCSETWDQHQGIAMQSTNYNDLFLYLNDILTDLHARTSPSGAPLADEVTLVVFSEMGRAPLLNAWGGKDHWTFTSTMLIGSGILGGQVIGAMDDGLRGRRVDLASGAVTDRGEKLMPGHLGATLLHLADIDPAEFIDDASPLLAALADP